MELISIADCDLCVQLPSDQHISDWEAPVPATWARLTTILVRNDWNDHWSARPTPDRLEFEEVRACRVCGTHYHYRQVYDSHSSEPRPAETDWYLSRLPPSHARDYFIDRAGPDGVVEHLDGGWLDQHYAAILGLLRRDLSRATDFEIKKHLVRSLYTDYVSAQDWDGLRATLLDDPDPAVGVYVASRIFEAIDPENLMRKLTSAQRYWDNLRAMLAAEPTRKPRLVAALAAGLSAPGQSLDTAAGEWVAVFGTALHTLRSFVPRRSLAPAIPALAAALQWAGSPLGWREAVRDLLIDYVGATRTRAKAVLKALGGDGDETRAVRAHILSKKAGR